MIWMQYLNGSFMTFRLSRGAAGLLLLACCAFQLALTACNDAPAAGVDWKDPQLGRESMVLMAEKVLPLMNA